MDFNSEQKKAILHKEGPLIIVAGAGTGKTGTITERIVHLITKEDVKTENILALTFTQKAANEMIERVDLKMPLSYEEVAIKTFHAFSEKVLRESGLEIGIDPGFKILGQVDQWFFFKENLYSFDLDYYRPLGNPNSFIYDLIGHFGKLKDELIDPDDYVAYCERIQGEEGDKMKEIAKCYKQYQDLLIKNNYLDFADLTYYVIKLFEKRSSVLKEYRERFKYVLVDEFQDTNYAQFKLLLFLAEEHRNIVVVGDDDQSIYKWRGASLSNILNFEESFPGCKSIVLNENYRNPQSVLSASYSLIQNNNPDRLEVRTGLNKKLKCNNDVSNPIEVHHFPSFLQESQFVAEKISALKQSDGVKFSDIAILIRSNHLAYPFVDELKYLSIPYQIRNPKGLLSVDEVKDLVAVIRFLGDISDDVALLRILKLDFFEVSMAEILTLLKSKRTFSLFERIEENCKGDEAALPFLESGFQRLLDLLKHLIEFSKSNSVGLVLNEFLDKSGYLKHLVDGEHYEQMENINQFARQVSKFERENEHNSIIDFSKYLSLLEEANAALNLDDSPDKDAVQILTAHGAKGLEFKYVFVVNLVNQRFPSSKRRESFVVPLDLTKEIYPEGDFHIQEERRLFYVAMTRAIKGLFLTYSDQYEGNKMWKVSPFVKEISDSEAVRVVDHEPTENAIEKLKSFKSPAKSIFNLPPFDSKRLSYSQIDTFKSCPLKYNYRYIMKVPVPSAHTANFGSAVHETLKEFYRALKSGKPVDFEFMKTLYEKNWIPFGYESKEHENIRKEKGLLMLKEYYEVNSNPLIVPEFIERPFNLKFKEHIISGRIDRIDKLADGTFEVIDYKTGRLKGGLNLKNDLQLSIYALACRDIFRIPVSSLSLYFLEGNEKVSTTRSVEQLANLEQELEEVITEMKNSDSSPTPGFLCNFCDFRLICPAV